MLKAIIILKGDTTAELHKQIDLAKGFLDKYRMPMFQMNNGNSLFLSISDDDSTGIMEQEVLRIKTKDVDY